MAARNHSQNGFATQENGAPEPTSTRTRTLGRSTSHFYEGHISLQPIPMVLQTTVKNGLKLKLRGQTDPFASYSYSLSPLMDKCVPVDWKPLINTDDVKDQHIRCHELQEGDELSMLVSNFKRQHAKALILVNTRESYSIGPELLEGFVKSNLPVVVLPRSDGINLLKVLNRYEGEGDVLARLDVNDSDQLDPFSHLKFVFKKVMFSAEKKLMVVSNEQANLVLVMAAISNYEKEVNVVNPPNFNKILEKIRSHFEKLCTEDLPFYITVMCRFYSRRDLYHCDDFILSCLNTIESRKPVGLAQTIEEFIKRGDFKVMAGFRKEEENVSMFWFMKNACLKLLDVSLKYHSQKSASYGTARLNPKFCYSRMMWLSLALKFHSKISQEIIGPAKQWYTQFINYFSRVAFTDQVIKDITSGLELGKQLNLPKGLLFDFQHLTDLVVSGRYIRPFKHLMIFVRSVECYISTEDKLNSMLTNIRAMYTPQLEEPNFNPAILSSKETFVDAIIEGIGFLDFLATLWEKRKFTDLILQSECVQWLRLLINMVNIPEDRSGILLSKFLSQKGVCKKYQLHVSGLIVSATRQFIHQINIQQFFALYKLDCKIWPKEFLQDYVSVCKLPGGIHINDSACKDFFSQVVTQFPQPHDHSYLVDLIVEISKVYNQDNHHREFIMDILRLKVSKLLSDMSANSKNADQDRETRRKFVAFLKHYIYSNDIKGILVNQMPEILKAISEERNEFQSLVLDVLSRETVPNLKALQELRFNAPGSNFLSTLQYCTNILKVFSAHLSAKETFCWGLVATCCSRISINSENLEWLHKYEAVISELVRIFSFYCSERKLTGKQAVIIQSLPMDVSAHSSSDVKRYFHWICHIQTAFQDWKIKLANHDVNYDEILMYASFNVDIERLCRTLQSTVLVKGTQAVQNVKNKFLKTFEQLNVYLLKYVPQQPEAKWCNFLVLLREHGVFLPQKLLSTIETYIAFPGDRRSIAGKEFLVNPVPISGVEFQPSSNISLQLTKHISFKQLSDLVADLKEFHEPLSPVVDMLTFFKLNPSIMFSTYLQTEIKHRVEIENASEFQSTAQSDKILRTLNISVDDMMPPAKLKSQSGITATFLKDCLLETKQLIIKIMKGEAAYIEITANGNLDLEKLDIEQEFTTLVTFANVSNISHVGLEGLQGFRNLLELFLYAKHIQSIHDVCEQYHLQGCLQDDQLEEVLSLVSDVKLEDTNSNLTPNIASERMKRIKLLLCIDQVDSKDAKTKSACLEVFPIVANCAEFFQFIRDKHFFGKKGQATFRQQYELVTAQLQHEEYEESVLNHLLAAFNVITVFMDDGQSFKTLMTSVMNLDPKLFKSHQLETVSENVTVIRVWFSRAEGDTLQNVKRELDKILEAGYYSFILPIEEKVQMTLEFMPVSNKPFSIDESLSGPSSLSSILSFTIEKEAKGPKLEQWNSEQIGDFVRKLGFIDTEREGGEKIKHFRYISTVAYRLLELYSQLNDLGSPNYCNNRIISFPCHMSHSDADNEVRGAENSLEKWKKQQDYLRSQYNWLLFFSMPKILHIYKLLSCESSNSEHLDEIVGEISFLCQNSETARNSLKKSIQEKLNNCLDDVQEGIPPMHVVGQFLGTLFDDPKFQLPRRSKLSSTPTYTLVDHPHKVTQFLHYCPHFTQKQLIQTVIGIYSRVPEAFEVFRCQPSTTEEELKLFLSKAACHSLQAIVLEVNKLPFSLQEGVMQLHVRNNENDLEARTERSPCIHFIETEPSILRDVPWLLLRDHKAASISFEDTQKVCKEQVVQPRDFSCIKLVVGGAGDGKTYYIKQQLQKSPASAQLTIAVNEAFTPLKAITKLCTLPINQEQASIFFNFTILPPGDSIEENGYKKYEQLMEVIGWFFFDLLILGYVEDTATGKSFRIPGGLKWAIYIEVPTREKDISLEKAKKDFFEKVPALGLLGTVHTVRADTPYTIDEDVQLVCKYLQAYDIGGFRGIDRLYRDGGPLVKFSLNPDISAQDCKKLLNKYMPEHICRSKIIQRLFIKYMKRRCEFLDNLPAFNYNTGGGEYTPEGTMTDTKQLGSTLMRTMLTEVNNFCDPAIMDKWSLKPHQQLIYDYKDHGASFGFISLHPHKLQKDEKAVLEKIGIAIPSMVESYHTRDVLDKLLSRALNIQLKNNRLTAIDDSAYVLTLDYTIKMLNIHERHECGVPVIIEGETGVGKTALVEMLSKLWNQSQLLEWEKQRGRIIDYFTKMLSDIQPDISPNYEACFQTVESLSSGEPVSKDHLLTLCELSDASHCQLYTRVQALLNPMRDDPVVAQLTLTGTQSSLEQLFVEANQEKSAEATATLLHAVVCAQVKSTFHKINVHSAMTPADVEEQFKPALNQAEELKESYLRIKARAEEKISQAASVFSISSAHGKKKFADTKFSLLPVMKRKPLHQELLEEKEKFMYRMPFVIVFLDEINTSSCLGLFKEIIVDKTIDGKPIPENVFIVAACNPHRGNSLASLEECQELETDEDKWMRGTYYVRKLHPTLRLLMWDYGSLNELQEKEYINTKMKMLNKDMSNPEVASLADLIVESQNQLRKYAYEQLKRISSSNLYATISSRSCVSQRDIQRVFTFFQWFTKVYGKLTPHGDCADYNRRAVLVALGVVYYMRLNTNYRKEYRDFINNECRLPGDLTFSEAFVEELDWYINLIEIPKGIARTQALKENIFATIVCTATHTPLIIVGAPGSSKTLSFNLTIANLKGAESRKKIFRDTAIFHSLDPYFYQCSRRTTSNEIQTVFSRAINRQRSHSRFNLPIYCVVFMDEAGLPEESHESLKILHYHLDKQEVSFVAISNHVLDAAKTNRAVSLFRPEASDEDLKTLAKGCFCSNPEKPPPELEVDLKTVVRFCKPYSTLMSMESFARFFGLRDFIQFVNYLRRKHDENQSISPQIVMQALERNFNGYDKFKSICDKFLGQEVKKVQHRSVVDIFCASLKDRPQEKQDRSENEVRYKLIIDPSEDDSLVRLFFTFGILNRENTRIFVCSNFPADGHLQKINTIAAIRHSAVEGHTIILSQTDDIHESFYDLFNQRFRRIDDLKQGPLYYANIAIGAHLRPSRVHSNFQCIVVVKKSEIVNTPSPFLNRFEKYLITHKSLLDTALNKMPPNISVLIKEAVIAKVKDFVDLISGVESLYGLKDDTLNSLIISLLPSVDRVYPEMGQLSQENNPCDMKHYLLEEIVHALREYTGLSLPKSPKEEFSHDVDAVLGLFSLDSKFKGFVQNFNQLSMAKAIPEAFNILHSETALKQGEYLSPETCFVIAVLQQWLVRHLCKRLMQLMTPEALILHRNKIPFSYLKNYLSFQTHFSLYKLVENYRVAATSNRNEPSSCHNATKVLCFTRSSPLILQLPTEFQVSVGKNKDATILKNFVMSDTDRLVMCKLSSLLSQSAMQNLINNFLDSDSTEVCLLVINMQKISSKIVNHVRIMIEEAEVLSKNPITKVFILLLHFSPAQFFHPCYPSLFLKSWDHYYLDTIAHSAVKGTVAIRDWFWQCCFPKHPIHEKSDILLQALLDMLPQAVPVIVSRVFFGSRTNGSFNCSMNGLQRTEAVNKLLGIKGQNEISLGRLLCEKFRGYWKPSVMTEQLEKAAIFSRNRESTLNITEAIQINFKNLFLDFLVYIISRINENYNLDILFDPNCLCEVRGLFLEILKVLPTTKLSRVTLLSNNLTQLRPQVYTPKFPFFSFVSELMEKIVEQSREEANVRLDILNEIIPTENTISRRDVLTTLQKTVYSRICEKMEGTTSKQVLNVVTGAISEHSELWNRYFHDFVLHKLQLDSDDSGGAMAQKILLNTLMSHLQTLEALERLISLHTYVHVYQLDLAKMASMLRPLNNLKMLHKDTSSILLSVLSPGTSASPPQSLSVQPDDSFGSPEHLTTFVVSTLFDALVGFLYPSKDHEKNIYSNTKIWYNVYRDMMSLPNLKEYIYSSLGGEPGQNMATVEAKLNLMQTTFITLQIRPNLDQDEEALVNGQQVFWTLFARHFNEPIELKTDCPRLHEMAIVSLEVITSNRTFTKDDSESATARVIIEGLLAHFFSPYRQYYHSEDIDWFLNLANMQKRWRSCSLENECKVLLGGVNDEFSPQREESPPAFQARSSQDATLPRISEGVLDANIFKFYLGKILDPRFGNTDSGPLDLYCQFSRDKIGVVLTSNVNLSPPGPFIPKFYKECSFIRVDPNCENSCMQQPLAHIYFITVLEHLMSKSYKLSDLVRLTSKIIRFCKSDSTTNTSKAVLYIELQAVLQVLAQQLAIYLDPTQPEKYREVASLLDNINQLMDDETTGGGEQGGHRMVVALTLFKLLNSSRRFTGLFLNHYDSLFRGISCIKQFRDQLKSHFEYSAHLLPFMMPEATGDMASLYNQVSKIMATIHKGGSVDSLKQLAEECAKIKRGRLLMNKPLSTNRKGWFRMMVWLVTYYEYFCQKKTSKTLHVAVGSPEILPYLEEDNVKIIRCFLMPHNMVHRKEGPNMAPKHSPSTQESITQLTNEPEKEKDLVYELFMPSNPDQQDQSDPDLCHSLANLVAVVMGCPARSNHLWYHIFAPKELVNSYMTGFMYNAKISPEGLQYDCGVELTARGEFGRSDYLKHAGRGTYTLHSLYLLLWANFGAFTMSLLTQPDADADIHGYIISENQSMIRRYCVSQLKSIWEHMKNNLGLSEEERTFFVNQCLKTFHEVMNGSQETIHSHQSATSRRNCNRGIFTTPHDLDEYEKVWHLYIFQPTWNQLQNKVATEYSSIQQNTLFADIKYLDVHYPCFPSETDFLHCVVSHGDLEQLSEGGELRTLSSFAYSWRILQAGGLLLPDLVEFYRWLHNELSHLLTYEETIKISILRVVQLAAKRYGSPMGEHITTLYGRVKKGYNDYVELIGGAIGAGACAAVKQGNRIYTIADDVPLLHFLTDSEQEEEGNDWLFTMITHIVETHNMAIESLYSRRQSHDHFLLKRLLPDQPTKVLLTELTDKNCLLGKFTSLHSVSSLLQVIRSRCQTPSFKTSSGFKYSPVKPSALVANDQPIFQLMYLEEDLLRLFYAGKPLIESPSSIRRLFKFNQISNLDKTLPDDVIRVTLDLEKIRSGLPEEYKEHLSLKLHKCLEYEFHSCDYTTLIVVITAFQNVCGHLKMVILTDAHSLNKEDLIDLTLPKFLANFVYNPLTDPQEVLLKIGIGPNSLKQSQLACLTDLPLPSVFACLQLFVQWIDQGVYDFCSLPLALKAHLSESDGEFFERELRNQWTGTLNELEIEIKQIIEALKLSERNITKRVNEQAPRISIIQYLATYDLIEDKDKLPSLIPETMILQHYVYFRLALRRLLIKLRAELKDVCSGKSQGNRWSEFVTDIWSARDQFNILREDTLSEGKFSISIGQYGFAEDTDSVSEEGSLFDVENVEVNDRGCIDISIEKDKSMEISQSVLDIGKTRAEPTRVEEKETEQSMQQQNLIKKASDYTPEEVGDFLCSIKLDKYTEAFVENEVSGADLLEADRGTFSDLGVESLLDCFRIATLFQRRQNMAKPQFPVSTVLVVLKNNGLEKYAKHFEENQVDGDMILIGEEQRMKTILKDEELMKSVLTEMGIEKNLDRTKIIGRFKKFAGSLS